MTPSSNEEVPILRVASLFEISSAYVANNIKRVLPVESSKNFRVFDKRNVERIDEDDEDMMSHENNSDFVDWDRSSKETEIKNENSMEIEDGEAEKDDTYNLSSSLIRMPSDFMLPISCSVAVLNALREKWIRTGVTPDDLQYFASTCLPVDQLCLNQAHISDQLLAELVIANQQRLILLDISDVQGLVGHEFNRLLEANNVFLHGLRTMRINSFELLVMPSTLPPQHRTGVDCRADGNDLPTVSAVDLNRSKLSIPYMECDDSSLTTNCDLDEAGLAKEFLTFTSRCPNVVSLSMQRKQGNGHNEDEKSVNEFLHRVLSPLKRLVKLDLSQWQRVDDLHAISFLSLSVLILYDVPNLYRALDTIVQLDQLKHLDLSQSTKGTGIYPKPVTALDRIILSLRNLTHLDISSTNLASQPSLYDRPTIENGSLHSDIYGLRGLKKPLEFLGLFNCENASHFVDIPAKCVTGDSDENQVLLALDVYRERAGLLRTVLNETFQLYRFGHNLYRHSDALQLVVSVMKLHLEDSTMQISGSASLFYIIRKVFMCRDTKRKVISALLNGMDAHMAEQVMIRNCCLSLCQFEIPQEVLFDYSRVARLLITALQHHSNDHLTQRIVVFLLNSMACHVDGNQKAQVGDLGGVEVILDQIQRKHAAAVCDDVMEVGWSFLWNITDETPCNCERFLAADGLRLFQACYQQFQNETELVRNMMGLIGNIAEVEHLRCELMNDDYIEIFCALLTRIFDGIEISYNSAGVLAHMVSDGDIAWISVSASRESVMNRIIEATEEWALDARRFINYRSFKPILRLIPIFDAPASQHWAIWALANLTLTDGEKYCAYVVKEGGVPLLEIVVNDERVSTRMRDLATTVLMNVRKWNTGVN